MYSIKLIHAQQAKCVKNYKKHQAKTVKSKRIHMVQ